MYSPTHMTVYRAVYPKGRAADLVLAYIFKLNQLFTIILLIGSILAVSSAGASSLECPSHKYKRTSQTPIIKDMVNPFPSDDDFELPMPCGGKLILKHVCVAADSFFADHVFDLGCEDCRRQDEGFMEAKRPGAIAGAFALSELPDPWRDKLINVTKQGESQCPVSDDGISSSHYYFIGKYEISSWQWNAVMGDECPGWDKPFTSEDPRPKTNISWFDAVVFTKRYTEWLLKNKPEAIPRFPDGRFAFVRLPTETEWEYAARGGHQVSPSQMSQEEFFPTNDNPFSDFAVYTQSGAAKPPERISWIGTRCPNPLDLYDTAGNAAEMMLDAFRFSIGSRLHGGTGGFVIKGGSYRKGRDEIMPGRREEAPFFLEDGVFRNTDLGFRIVLSGIVTPQNRSETLRQQWKVIADEQTPFKPADQTSESVLESVQVNDLLSEIEGITATVSDGTDKKTLQSASEYIKKINPLLANYEDKVIEGIFWQALFAMESLLNYTLRSEDLQNELEILDKLTNQAIPESDLISVDREITKKREQLRYTFDVIDYLTQSYLTALEGTKKYSTDTVERQIRHISRNPNLDGQMRLLILKRLSLLVEHVVLYTNNPENLPPGKIKEDILLTIRPF